jgi:hypothetical protein
MTEAQNNFGISVSSIDLLLLDLTITMTTMQNAYPVDVTGRGLLLFILHYPEW